MGDDNGSRYVTVRWLVGILVAVLIMGAGAFVNDLRGDVDRLQEWSAQARETRQQMLENSRRLQRIEDKIDALSDRVSRGYP